MKITAIESIGNYYGSLNVMSCNNKFYWIIENYDTDFCKIHEWEEIPEELYNSIIKFQKK